MKTVQSLPKQDWRRFADAPGYLDVSRAQAALWLLNQIDGRHLSFSHGSMNPSDLEETVRGIATGALGESLAAAQRKITAAATRGNSPEGEPPHGLIPLHDRREPDASGSPPSTRGRAR